MQQDFAQQSAVDPWRERHVVIADFAIVSFEQIDHVPVSFPIFTGTVSITRCQR